MAAATCGWVRRRLLQVKGWRRRRRRGGPRWVVCGVKIRSGRGERPDQGRLWRDWQQISAATGSHLLRGAAGEARCAAGGRRQKAAGEQGKTGQGEASEARTSEFKLGRGRRAVPVGLKASAAWGCPVRHQRIQSSRLLTQKRIHWCCADRSFAHSSSTASSSLAG